MMNRPGRPRPAPPHPSVRSVIAVGSGKGGVGKSTVALNLALALAETGATVGLLDADMYGPSIPLMMGLVKTDWAKNWTLAGGSGRRIPSFERFGLRVMSAGFIVGEEQPLADASLVSLMVGQLMFQTDWGELDHLVVDFPPGTGGVQQTLISAVRYAGAILVVTPQDVAHLDARKAVTMYRAAGVPILGGVENMSGFVCPDCGKELRLFSQVRPERALWAMGVDSLGKIPLAPEISEAGDAGEPLLVGRPDSPQAAAFRHVRDEVLRRLG
jgi:ATP-binding protein involved in chromosome partitioning